MAKFSLDCLGEACPIPLIRTQEQMEKMEIGDELIVNVDHSCAMKNVPDWAISVGHNVEVQKISNGEWNIIIQKKK